MNPLPCPECHKETMQESIITLAYAQDGVTLRINKVPALVCSNCGKQLVIGDVAHQVSDTLRVQQVKGHAALQHLSLDVHQLQEQITQVKSASLELVYA